MIFILILLIVFQFPIYFLVPNNLLPIKNTKLQNSIIRYFISFLLMMALVFFANFLPFIFSLYYIFWFVTFITLEIIIWSWFIYKIIIKKITFNWLKNKTDLLILIIVVSVFLLLLTQTILHWDADNYFYVNMVEGNSWFVNENQYNSYSNTMLSQSYYLNESYYELISLFYMINNNAAFSTLYINRSFIFIFTILIFMLFFRPKKSNIFIYFIIFIFFIFNIFYWILFESIRGVDVGFFLGIFFIYFLLKIYNSNIKRDNILLIIFPLAISAISTYFILVSVFIILAYILWNKKINNYLIFMIIAFISWLPLIRFDNHNITLSIIITLWILIVAFFLLKFNIANFINPLLQKFNNKIFIWLMALSPLLLLVFCMPNLLPNWNIKFLYKQCFMQIFDINKNHPISFIFVIFVIAFAISWFHLLKYNKITFGQFWIIILMNPFVWPIIFLILKNTNYRIYYISILEVFLIVENFIYLFIKHMWNYSPKLLSRNYNKKMQCLISAIFLTPLIISSVFSNVYSHHSYAVLDKHHNYLTPKDFGTFNNNLKYNDFTIISSDAIEAQLFLKNGYFISPFWNGEDVTKLLNKLNLNNGKNSLTNQEVKTAIKQVVHNIENKGIINQSDYLFLQNFKINDILVYTNNIIDETSKSHIKILTNFKSYYLLKISLI